MPQSDHRHDTPDTDAGEEDLRLRPVEVYDLIRQEGEEELRRPWTSLWWSGVAAGLAISLSVVAEGLIRSKLPPADWRPLIDNLGYTVGFLVVILGRMQLFTENTVTAVLPVMARPTWAMVLRTARLWGIVFGANLAGTLIFAMAAAWSGAFPADQLPAYLEVARHFMAKTPAEMLLHGIPAGFMIAAVVWMLPSAKGAEVLVIVTMTYLIALGDFTHVVAGSAEAFLLLLVGEVGLGQLLAGFLVPAFIGNVLGGTALFALLAHAQVRKEF